MRRHAPTHSALPALLLVVFLAALSLFAVPAVGATAVQIATNAGPQAAKPETAAAARQGPAAPTVHDDATVHRGSASPAHSVRLPLATDPGGASQHLSRPGATGTATTAGDELGRRATITVQGRAPPATAR
ncbi:MAG: hypothetical protein ACRDUV_18410 [Pseudonocardiaceae bacterium]